VLGHSSVALECLLYLIALVDRWCFICVTGPLLQSIANAFEETQVIFAKKNLEAVVTVRIGPTAIVY
jgi:hypothetical protein